MSKFEKAMNELREYAEVEHSHPIPWCSRRNLGGIVVDLLAAEPPREMTQAERAWCHVACPEVVSRLRAWGWFVSADRCDALCGERNPPPKRTLADVERDLAAHDMSTAVGRDCVRDLLAEHDRLTKESIRAAFPRMCLSSKPNSNCGKPQGR